MIRIGIGLLFVSFVNELGWIILFFFFFSHKTFCKFCFVFVVCMGWTTCMLNVGPLDPHKDNPHMGSLSAGSSVFERAGLIMGTDLHSSPYKKSDILE